ncbi:Predicted ATP-binding protein involved in virulence [Serratia quinivorans]|uniref:AAA family ATPase n=1 Tax=Serratia quinivorans TaxID=137545 RepID=UPI002179177E|nr:AAA family ATPase [Serratia quinivorans]CAI1656671.1 Predicted ATP-binding protein involved in virulence [Serratia quinivorans]
MKVLVTAPSRKSVPDNNDVYDLILQQDDWNDYSFVTKYHLYLTKKITKSESIEYAGAVKIIKKGQPNDYSFMIGVGELDSLGDEFCSIGQSLDYYGRLSELKASICNEILFFLRDINLFDYQSQGFKEEKVWHESVMRDLKVDDDIFTLPIFIIKNQFSSIPSISEKLTFSHSGMVNPLYIYFDSTQYGFFETEKLPCRMSVIVGRNGSGKSTTLARLSKVAYSSTQDRKEEVIKNIGEILPEGLGFPKVINLSYSAFDSFQIPGVTYKEKLQLKNDLEEGRGRYIYCGVRDVCAELDSVLSGFNFENDDEKYISVDRQENTVLKPLEVLSDEFCKAFNIVYSDENKKEIFMLTINKLREEASLSSIVDDLIKDDFIMNAKDYFHGLSTGHKFVLHSMLHIILHADKRCLILFDEPETHLHPPLLAVLMSALRIILNKVDAFSIVATHSPVVVQETLSKNVNVISRSGNFIDFQRPDIETFGENIGAITSSVFSLTTQVTDYHNELDKLVMEYRDSNNALDMIEKCFDEGLSIQARAYIMSKLAIKEK